MILAIIYEPPRRSLSGNRGRYCADVDAEAGIAILLKLDVVLFCHVHESSCTRLQKELAYIPTMHFHSGNIPSMLRPFSGGGRFSMF